MTDRQLITDTQKLRDACWFLKKGDYIALDTEFIRQKTYWPILCLIQIAGKDDVFVLDVLSKTLDLSPFLDLLQRVDIVKILHAGRQDLEIFHAQYGFFPAPLFDTQIAAMACGYGHQAAYDVLVKKICDVQLDKSQRFTDWSQRPLSNAQICYAKDDVRYLPRLYQNLHAKLDEANRLAWIDEEIALLVAQQFASIAPENAWKKIKFTPKNRRVFARICAFARLREAHAQKINRPRNWVLKDDLLLALAQQKPEKMRDALDKINGNFFSQTLGQNMQIAAQEITQCHGDSLACLPPAGLARGNARQTGMVKLLRALLQKTARQNAVAENMLATSKELEMLVAWPEKKSRLHQGWRYEIFGKTALALLAREEAAIGKNTMAQDVVYPQNARQTEE